MRIWIPKVFRTTQIQGVRLIPVYPPGMFHVAESNVQLISYVCKNSWKFVSFYLYCGGDLITWVLIVVIAFM